MNNGNHPNPNPFNFNELVPFQPITAEQYQNNMAQIQAMREMLATFERTNVQAYETYRREQERQQLEAIAEQGRLAQQRLAQLNTEMTAQNPYAPPVAGPSTLLPQYHAGYNEVPSSARIVEIPNSAQSSPQLQSFQGQWGEAAQAHAHWESYASLAAKSTQTQTQPQTQTQTQPQTQTQQTRHSGTSYATASSYPVPVPAPGQKHSYPTSSTSHRRANTNHYSISQPTASTSAAAQQGNRGPSTSSHAGSSGTSSTTQPPTSRTARPSSNISRTNGVSTPTQQASGSSASQQGAPPKAAPFVDEELLYQVFRNVPPHAVKELMLSTHAMIKAQQNGTAVSAVEWEIHSRLSEKARQVVETLSLRLKDVPVDNVREIFARVYTRLRIQPESHPAPPQSSSTSGPVPGAQSQTQPVQPQPPSMATPATQTQAQGSSAKPPAVSARSATSVPQANTVQTRPPTTQPTIQTSVTQANTVQTRPPQPTIQQSQPNHVHSAQPSLTRPPPSQPPAARPPPTNQDASSSVPTSTAPSNGALTQVEWYKPRDPSAPMAFRNSDGQIQFIFQVRSQQASASAPATQTVLSTPTQPPLQTQFQTSTAQPQTQFLAYTPQGQTQFQTSTPQPQTQFHAYTPQRPTQFVAYMPQRSTPSAEQQSESSWSPQKADRRRLAQDIIRSLGPPKGAFGTPLPPLTTSSSEDIEHPTESAKRKPSPGATPSTPSKRQRVGDGGNESEALPDASLSVENKDGQVDVVVAPLATEPISDPDIIDLTMDEPVADGPVGTEQIDQPETIPVRVSSVTSSDAADAHQVQEAIGDTAPESSAGPSSPAVRTTKSPSLGATLEEVNRLHPSQDLDYVDGKGALDMPDESIALLSPTRPPQSSVSSPASVVRPKEKLPLFLPSRSSSPDPEFSRQASAPPPTDDDDLKSITSSSRRFFDSKGKGKARQIDTDVEMASSRDGDEYPRRKGRRSKVYVLAPPLPAYARKRRSSLKAASRETSVDELATCPVDDDEDNEMSEADEEVQAAAELSYSRLRETPCQWAGCGAILNSTHTLQKHLALHAGEQDEWGSYACRWHGCLTSRFVDKTGLLKHLNKHALIPLRCAYEGCEEWFDAPNRLLEHHQSSKHRNGTGELRPTCELFLPAERRRPLPPLPEVVPAYMAVPCPVSMHPISKERHQWLGGKVLENIMCFKWQGRRSNAAAPSRESRRLAEKMAASELAGKTPAESLALIKRWIDGEYLDLTDGYDASRRHHLHCNDIGSGEVTKMVHDGLVLFSNEPEPPALPETTTTSASTAGRATASTVVGPERDAATRGNPTVSVVGATEANVAAPGVLASGPHDRADQLVGDVSDPDGKVDAGGRFELPRRDSTGLVQTDAIAVAGNSVAEPGPGDLLQDGGSAQLGASTQQEEER